MSGLDAEISSAELAALAEAVASLRSQQDRLMLRTFTNADAWAIGCWAVESARERGYPVVIDIRRGDQILFHAALEGTNADNDSWVDRKARSVRRFAMSSLLLGRTYQLHVGDFNEKSHLPFTEYVAAGGCLPIIVRDVGMVGTITVSGLDEQSDHDFAVEAIEWHIGDSQST